MPFSFPGRPLISVVMPVYNRQEYVGEAIQSILAQTYSHFEFIIVDDGSTDDSPRIIREFAERDARIHPLFLEHGGVARAMNRGVEEARGPLLARMDHDDIALSQRFAVQLACLREHRVDVCGSNVLFFGDMAGPLWFPESHEIIRRELIFRPAMLFPTLLLRTEIYRAHPLDPAVRYDDYALCCQLAPHYRLGNVPQILLKHRCHAQQTERVNKAALQAEKTALRRRCFQDLFPQATSQDWACYERLATYTPCESIAELRLVGGWLTEFAQFSDSLYRQGLVIRWRGVCRRSAGLGAEYAQIYHDYLLRINPEAQRRDYDF